MKRLISTSTPILTGLLIVAPTVFSACSNGNGDHAGLAVSFDGSWQGTWSTSSQGSIAALEPSGLVTLQLVQAGTSVTGTASFTGHPCLSTCNVSCQANGHDLSGRLGDDSFPVMFSGTCPESSHCSGPHHANSMTATYRIENGSCAGESGVIQLTPVAALGSQVPEVGAFYIGELILVDPATPDIVRLPLFERSERAR